MNRGARFTSGRPGYGKRSEKKVHFRAFAPLGLVTVRNKIYYEIGTVFMLNKVDLLIGLITVLNEEPLAVVVTCLVRMSYLVYQQVRLIIMFCHKDLYIGFIGMLARKDFL